MIARTGTLHACLAISLALLLETQAGSARANDDRELFQQGVALYDQGQYAEAVQAFLKARAIRVTAKTDLNIGLAHFRLNQLPQAATYYELASGDRAQAESSRVAAKARGLLEEVLKQVARVRLVCPVSGAEVIVDGEARGRTPLETSLYLEPGSHRIVIYQPGLGAEFLHAAVFTAGSHTEVPVRWKAAASSSAPGDALSAASDEKAALAVRRRNLSGWAYGTLGAGLACIATSGVLLGLAVRDRNEYNDFDGNPPSEWPNKRDTNSAGIGKLVAAEVIGGLGLAAIGVSIYYFLGRPEAHQERAASMPALKLSTSGLGLAGRF